MVTFRHFTVEFDKTGAIFDESQVDAVVNASAGLTDLIIISHGWNNDMAEAKQLYDDFFKSVDVLLGIDELADRVAKPLATRTFGVVRVFWPSKKFAPEELIPAGGVASAGSEALVTANQATLRALLEKLKYDPARLGGSETDPDRVSAMNRALGLITNLASDADARRQFVAELRSILDSSQKEPDDGSDEFFASDPLQLFKRLGAAVVAPPPPNPGGAASLRDVVDAAGGAIAKGVSAVGNAVSDVAEGAEAAARRLANFVTYATMKERAGLVGRKGVSDLLRRVKANKPDVKLHLVGHSFGGRLVTSAASTFDIDTVASMTLLQAAFSHNGLGEKYDNIHDGFFRAVIRDDRVTGPIIITHTKNDVAVGIAYPLASRLTRDTAAALGDENDPYGGMGRNGAQHTPEAQTGSLLPVGRDYFFAPGKVYNLRADEFIMDHGDVAGFQVAYAFLNAVLKVSSPARGIPSIKSLPEQFQPNIGDYYARVTVPRDFLNPEKREQFGLPENDEERGSYIIELNVQHIGSLPGAANAFEELFKKVLPNNEEPVRISKSYYRCQMNVPEWGKLLDEDGKNPSNKRSIYKLWPDFPVKGQIDRSISTIKADAAQRAFDAGGSGIVWAVIDSGIDKNHPHFGKPSVPGQPDDPNHLLTNSEVNDLHRYFAYNRVEEIKGVPIDLGPLKSPDLDPAMEPTERAKLVGQHRSLALKDNLGHGTHVAGIIAGRAPAGTNPHVFEREFKPDEEGKNIGQGYKIRSLSPRSILSGVAPQCKLISLRVLNDREEGRVSSVITALNYIREQLNNNPKMMRVHGVNLSVGYNFDAEMFACGQSPLCVEVDRLVQSGVVVVTAAGNTGFGSVAAQVGGAKVGLSNTINDPGNAALAITVGSTHREMPHTYGVSFFSSKGPTGDGRLKPDLVAPGERITSCAAGSKLEKAVNGLPPGQRPKDDEPCYMDDSGTSMAAPHVSGAIAAFLSIRREFIGKPLEVKRIFLQSATPLGRERYFEGHGLVDLMRAIQSV